MVDSRKKRFVSLFLHATLTELLLLLLAAGTIEALIRGKIKTTLLIGLIFLGLAVIWLLLSRSMSRCGVKHRRMKCFIGCVRDLTGRERFHARTLSQLHKKYDRKPTDFEQYIAALFRKLGWEATVTPPRGDGGIDIHLRHKNRYQVVEVKLYAEDHHVGRELIQKLWAAQLDARADGAIFVTTSDFTQNAIDFAERSGIVLINGEELSRLIEKMK